MYVLQCKSEKVTTFMSMHTFPCHFIMYMYIYFQDANNLQNVHVHHIININYSLVALNYTHQDIP